MKIKSIGVRLGLQVSIITVVAMILVYLAVQRNTALLINNILLEQSENANQYLEQSLEQMENAMLSQAEFWAQHPSVIQSVQNDDAAALLRELNANELDFLTVTDKNGIVIARSKSENKGDSLLYQSVIRSALEEGVASSAIETGNQTAFAIRGAAPIIGENGAVIGAVTCGYDLSQNKYVEQIKAQSNCEVTIFLEDIRISTTLNDQDGKSLVGTAADPAITQQVLREGQKYTGQLSIFGKNFIVNYRPLEGQGTVIGMLFSGVEIDSILALQSKMLWVVLLIILASATAVSISVFLLAHFSITRPLHIIGKTAQHLEKGELGLVSQEKITINVYTGDEVEVLARALENTCHSLQGYIGEINTCIQGLSAGRLDIESNYPFSGDFVHIKTAINETILRFRGIMHQLKEISLEISGESEDLANVATRVSNASSEQSESIVQLSSAVSDIRSHAEKTAQQALSAFEEVADIRNEMEANTRQMDLLNQAIENICRESEEISIILKSIEDITFQTNILALNASIEAARAGYNGKGFSVIAGEVRLLAAKSAEASVESARLIENTLQAVESGRELSGKMSSSFGHTLKQTLNASEHMKLVQQDIRQQAIAIEEMNVGIQMISDKIMDNAASSETSASASRELARQAEILHQMIAAFKLEN